MTTKKTSDPGKIADPERLRKHAQQVLADSKKPIDDMSSQEVTKLVEELRIHQIELEIQNEELRRTQSEIEASRKSFQDLWELSPAGYLTVDFFGRVTAVNRSAQKLFGRPENELLKEHFSAIVAPENHTAVHLLFEKVLETEITEKQEIRVIEPDGSVHFCLLQMSLLEDGSERKQVQAIITDITKSKEAEEALRVAVEGGRLGTWNRDLITDKIDWNLYLYELLGRDPYGPVITAETFFTYIHPDDIERVRRHLDETLLTANEFADEFRVIRENGEVRWLASSGHAYRDSKGRLAKMAGVYYDITGRKKTDEALRRSEARYRSFIELTEQFGWTTNRDGEVVEDLPLLRKFTGLSDEQMKGWGWLKMLHPGDVTRTAKVWRRSVAEKSRYELEYRVRRYDGVYRHFLARGVPVLNNDGHVQEWVGVCIDISERKEMEEILKVSHEELEQRVKERTAELSRRASQLARLTSELTLAEQKERRRIADMLHDDLQQLMVGAKMGQEILIRDLDHALKPEAMRVLDLIKQSLKTSRSLTAELSPPVLQSGDLTAAIVWLAQWMKETHGFAVKLKIKTRIVLHREDLAILLFQSIRELFLNVLKHASVKSVIIKTEHKNGELRIIVSDRGKGFDPEFISNHASVDQKFGLFSIRERLYHFGCRLALESAPNEGSTISLLVPIDETKSIEKNLQDLSRETRAKSGSVPSRKEKIRVMIADDHAVVRGGLSAMLGTQPDIEVVGEAIDGEKAVHMAHELAPDVILMDINMPNMNGMEATRVIHSELPHIRIIGLSMYDKNEQAAAILSAGAYAYLSKSDDIDHLIAVIREVGE
ncbi:PAS domain S-box protein [Thermodesulfobacteriota bacterium]